MFQGNPYWSSYDFTILHILSEELNACETDNDTVRVVLVPKDETEMAPHNLFPQAVSSLIRADPVRLIASCIDRFPLISPLHIQAKVYRLVKSIVCEQKAVGTKFHLTLAIVRDPRSLDFHMCPLLLLSENAIHERYDELCSELADATPVSS